MNLREKIVQLEAQVDAQAKALDKVTKERDSYQSSLKYAQDNSVNLVKELDEAHMILDTICTVPRIEEVNWSQKSYSLSTRLAALFAGARKDVACVR